MMSWFKRRPLAATVVGLSLGLLVGVGMMVGTLVTMNQQQANELRLPETVLNATASHSGQTFAMATGPVDADIEGLFLLDYLTGELQCWVVNPRNGSATSGKFYARFTHNVIADLGVQQGKNPDYVMVTGQTGFVGFTGVQSPANTIVYVADGNTGNIAAYTIMWNRTMARSGAPITGAFTLLHVGKARSLPTE